MKKSLLFCLILTSIGVLAQTPKTIAQKITHLETQKVNFQKFNVLNVKNEKNSNIEQTVKNATLATLDMSSIQSIYQQKAETIEISIPYNGSNIDVVLYKVNPFTDGFTVDTNLKQNVQYTPGVYYRGIVKGNLNSVASFNFFDDKFNGIISADEFSNLNIGKLTAKNNQSDYIVYSDVDLVQTPDWTCETEDFAKDPSVDQPESMQFLGSNITENCVTMYYEIDYHIYFFNESSIDETMDWMSGAFNNMQTLYNNDDITVALNHVFIWETMDPYQGSGGSGNYLAKFNEVRPYFAGDVGQLIGAFDSSGGGVAATIDGLCSEDNYSYAGVDLAYSEVPIYSWTIMVMTHENGHVLGSRHTHACVWNGNNTAIDGCAGFVEGSCALPGNPPGGGTMMSYCHLQSVGINFNLGFGPQPKTVLINNINSQTCLSTDCVSVCFNTVEDITITNITMTEAVLSWTDADEDAEAWEYAVRPIGNNDALVWTETSTNTVNLDDLEPNTFYNAYIRKLCGDMVTIEFFEIFVTDGDFCNGDILTDSGGPDGGYTNNENYVRTIVPTTPGEKVKITFTEFNVETNNDFLYIHDGMDTDAPELYEGGLTGNLGISEGPFESTDASGAITLHFVSNETFIRAGWVGQVECLTLGVDDLDAYLDFSYYPNPVTNLLNIVSKNEILDATVYNMEGRKLSTKQIKNLSTQLDLSSYPVGTYIIELKFKEKPVQFKVLKK